MRLIFSLVGLLVVVVIVGLLVKQQLKVIQAPVDSAASAPAPSGTPTRQSHSQQLQRQVGDDVKKALEQGMSRNEAESRK